MHSVYSLKHDLIALDLSGAVQVALVGDRVIGLSEVGVAEGVGHAIVEPLDGLIRLLAQVLEANAKSLCSVLRCVGLQEFVFKSFQFSLLNPKILSRVLYQDRASSLRER